MIDATTRMRFEKCRFTQEPDKGEKLPFDE